ncbi:single-stranded DNA-binding protein WHY1, chloroplastic-like [Cucurbita pepo subsp. pepo]|uniref:single-stranded DNA-binding protein WHY1, chloroplastic-like n=1 Tax=Cucurbita pepo subsp. pepo TaxID=3664 RepID=UPI000C9D80E7|nr:single-stranded DNA-binding protein WHY1, chloroplastic-like [Cucurbita pepo subsp. pepo]
MLRLQWLSSSLLPPLNPPELCAQPCSNRRRCRFNSSRQLFTLTATRKPSPKCQYASWNTQQPAFEPASQTDSFSPQTSAGAAAALPPRFFVGHSIYKGKAALSIEPRPPEFTPIDSGAFKVSRQGFVMLQLAPAAGVRQYDWSRKQVFSLSLTELGSLVSLGPRESCEFFHDPYKGKSDEGKVRKILKVEPLPDGSGHFFNLSVQNKLINVDESIYIPITKAEYTVLVEAFKFILPHLMGWHTIANTMTRPEDSSRVNNANPRYGGESGGFEWSR